MLIKETRLKPFGMLVEPVTPGPHVHEVDIKQLRELFHREQLLVLRGFQTFSLPVEFSDYCEKWGQVSEWPFGKVLELMEQKNPQDHIFDNSYVPLHWDGMYRPEIPEYQIFHCSEAPSASQGGRTTFSNTILALKHASLQEKALWEKVTGCYERKMEFYNSKTISPIIAQHPYKNFSIIRYNEPPNSDGGNFVNPPNLEFTGIDEVELDALHRSLQKALYAPTNFYAHEWQASDIVIADNFSLLHGRDSFISRAPRHLQRVHVLSDPPLNNPGLEYYQ
jgi:alpha-ketoglutarate-dependent taurine dioxygenase